MSTATSQTGGETADGGVRIVLVRPAGPRNVGAVLRAVTNFGPAEIVVVGPVRPSLLVHPDFEQMAHGVEDMAARIRVVDGLDEALAECTSSFGFTARVRQSRRIEDWRSMRKTLVQRCSEPRERVAIVFGNEETGLSGDDADRLQTLLKIPTTDEHTSINLAMTVGIVLSTIFLDRTAAPPEDAGASARAPLEGSARDYLRLHVRDVLVEAARSDPIKQDIAVAVDRVFSTAELQTKDGRAWHAVMRALGNRKKPADYGLDPSPEAGDRRRKALERHAGETGDDDSAP